MSDNKKIGATYQYFFILGNTPILSSAEIFAVLGRRGLAVRLVSVSEEVAIIETNALIDPLALMATLGGTIKIGAMLPSSTTTEQWVRSRKSEGRIVVGVSVYKSATGVSNAKCEETLRTVRGEILTCKRALKEEGKALRLVTGRERALPSVALVTEHILERGGELVVFLSNNGETQFGETNAVQAFHAYRSRDMGRPSRDALRGMLPQKVAQMMINCALYRSEATGAGPTPVICDPFCGSGTVLSEAALLGYNVIGSDISEEAVADTQKNFQWLKNDSRFTIHDSRFFVSDVRSIADHLEKQSVDAIVTEPYLGPPLTGGETPELLGKVRRDIHTLVTDAFGSFTKVVRAGGRVVIILPVLGGELLRIDGIEELGWRLVSVVPEEAKRLSGITARGTILYSRDDQHLAREITVWERE
ncbi:MAG: methyltransferase domain-containing protein [bacterium]|nr:methyltransferase domain-containing protein [bacterium]